MIQSSDMENESDQEENESEGSSGNPESQEDTPTPVSYRDSATSLRNKFQEEAEELLKQLTTKIWKTTDEILRAHTGIS